MLLTTTQIWCSVLGMLPRSSRRGQEDAVTKRRGNSVLCIGNDPINLNLRCALLKEHGWSVLSSGSGHEGVIRFNQEVVDVVVVDLDDDGTEAALITGELKPAPTGSARHHSGDGRESFLRTERRSRRVRWL